LRTARPSPSFAARWTLVRPIRELERSMSMVEAGDLDAEAALISDDEIGRSC